LSNLGHDGVPAESGGAHDAEVRLHQLARRLHSLGERPLFELLREIVSGADAVDRLEAFARLDPAIVALLGGSALPSILTTLDGGRA